MRVFGNKSDFDPEYTACLEAAGVSISR